MKRSNISSALIVLFCVVLVSGCAKEPVVESMDTEALNEVSQMEQSTQNVDDTKASENATVADLELERVYFVFDQFTLTEKARGVLGSNATILQSTPTLKVSIEGHCDSRGSDEYNLALGERRSQVIKNYLISLGVAPDRLVTLSYGEELPVDTAETEMAWAMNRRAEFKIIN